MSYKNPFSIRVSERIETDERFLDLFSVEPLTYLEENYKNDSLWGTLTYIMSTPGAGKTTLLRLFSPSVLQKVTKSNYPVLFKKLKRLEVRNGEQIQKCGVYLQMGREYKLLEDEQFSEAEQTSIFLSLLNARIVLATLKTCMTMAGVKYTDLDRLTYTPDEPIPEFGAIKASYTGKELLDWAADKEGRVCEFLDSFLPPEGGFKGNIRLFALSAMKASWFRFDDKPLCDEFIFQIDDGHKLSDNQQKIIRDEVAGLRQKATLWLAERMESLSSVEILSDNNIMERDFQVIKLDTLSQSLFNRMATTTASIRSKQSEDGIDLFTYLSEISTVNYTADYNEKSAEYLAQLKALPVYENFADGIEVIQKEEPYERVLHSRALLIYASRQSVRLFGYDAEEIQGILREFTPLAADLLPGEIKRLPQYYGSQTLINLSAGNIELFLHLSSRMFEVLLAKKIMDSANYALEPETQDSIIKSFCKKRFEEIKRLPRGNKIYAFLNQVIDFCKEQTYSESYSYRTVSGFAVREENSGRYGFDGFWFQDEKNSDLALLLRDCMAFNLLEKDPHTQGEKGQNWTVFYLNYWLCAHANLPLRRGGWRKLPLSQLKQWINQ